ncbi:TIR-like protein FxsC [Streptomyces erythrochromogenes]|uniref:TIR-like protein FxsC n=1 Tax=Streptomyces erythrochromogenes TaxID=285574 RepID=UPI0034271746
MPEEGGGTAGAGETPDRRDEPLATVVSALHGLGRELDGLSVAELLWLASLPRGGRAVDAAGAEADPAPPASDGAADPRERLGAWRPLRPVYGPAAHGGDALPARQVSLPRGAALPRAREIARALRPLRRPWPAGRRRQLDIRETVAGYARTGELVPTFRPAPERWFDLTLVLDRSATMAVWGDTAEELRRVLATTGAFRTLRVREVDSWQAGLPHPTADRRRLVLVLSDCVSAAGGDQALWDRIRAWAGSAPTVLVNPLPPKIWRHTGLDLPAVKVTAPGAPGAPNPRLHYLAPPLMEDVPGPEGGRAAGWVPLPVVGLTPRSFARWARTLMRGDPEGCDAVLVPAPGAVDRTPPAPAPARAPDGPADAGQLVGAFLHRASTPAVRLAVLCSAYPRLSAGMLHLVRQELVPEATPADMAEVVVGGLVSVEEGGREGAGAVTPVLRFRDGVREHLAPRLGARDALRTREAVSRFMAAHADAPSRFTALVPDTAGDTRITPDQTPFAQASPQPLPAPDGFARPARPPVPAEMRPYFFLSYAHTPRFGASGPDPDMWVERLYRDLSAHVMALTDIPAGHPVGFMDREIRSGEGWSDRLGEVLATCRVFVPLYSPRYFASETCGKEWYAFAQRAILHQTRSSSTETAIVPAWWVPVPPDQLPHAAAQLAVTHYALGERYVSDGLYGLIKLRSYAEEYERAVYELAKRIVRVADTADIPAGRPVDYRSAPSAFGPRRAPGQGDLRIAVAAPTVRDLPDGRDAHYYGAEPEDWNPFHPESSRPLAHVATELAYQNNNQVAVTTLAEEVSRAADGAALSGPLILLVDRWALRVPALREALAALDVTFRPGTSVVTAWNRSDPQSRAANVELNASLLRAMPKSLAIRSQQLRSVRGLQEFTEVLPHVVAATYQEHFRHAQVYPPADSAAERPRLRGHLSPDTPRPPGTGPQ